MVLARILTPEDFGIFGFVILFYSLIALLGNLGFGAALLQREELDEGFLSTAYWTNMAVSILLLVVSIIAAPVFAHTLDIPFLKWAIIFFSINYFFQALVSVHAMFLYREMQFKTSSLIEIFATVVRVVFILSLALLGFGVWSLIIGITVERIVKTLLFLQTSDWRPQWIFDNEKFQVLFHFGKNCYGNGFVEYFQNNIDFWVVGILLGAKTLGIYQFAFNLPHLIVLLITMSIESVCFSMFSRLQNDLTSLRAFFLKTIQMVSLIVFPFLFGLSFLADDFVRLAYGEQWVEAITPLRILAIAALLKSLTLFANPVLKAIGRPDKLFQINLILLPVSLILIFVSAKFYGIFGVAIGMSVYSCIRYVILHQTFALIQLKLNDFFQKLIAPCFLSIGMMIILFLIQGLFLQMNLHLAFVFLMKVLTGVLVYVVLFRMFYQNLFNEIFVYFQGVLKR